MSTPTPRTCGEISCDECNARTAALIAERDQLRFEGSNLRAGQKACEACDEPTAFQAQQLRATLTAERDRLRAEIIRLRTENSDLKATDTRPLLTGKLTHAGLCRIDGGLVDGVFIVIDRDQIKACRRLPMYQEIELRIAADK